MKITETDGETHIAASALDYKQVRILLKQKIQKKT